MKTLRFRMTDQSRLSDAVQVGTQYPVKPEEILPELFQTPQGTDPAAQQYTIVGWNEDNRRYRQMPLSMLTRKKTDILETDAQGRCVRISNLVGILHRPITYKGEVYDVSLEIRSRFDPDAAHPWFLLTMLHTVIDESEWQPEKAADVFGSTEEILQFLSVWIFGNMLKNCARLGIYRTYERREYNDDRFCGSFDAARHLRCNMGQDGCRIAYVRRERVSDNAFNRLVLCTWEHLCQQYPAASGVLYDTEDAFRTAIRDLQCAVGYGRTDVQDCIARNTHPITGPYYTDYEALRRYCLSILWEEGGAGFGGDDIREIKGILVYIPDLWERFLMQQLRPLLHTLQISCQTQHELAFSGDKQAAHPDLRRTGMQLCSAYGTFLPKERLLLYWYTIQRLLWNRIDCLEKQPSPNKQASRPIRIRPDFVFFRDSETRVCYILDAKIRKAENLCDPEGFPKLLRDQICYHMQQYLFPLMQNVTAPESLAAVFIPRGGLIYPTCSRETAGKPDGICALLDPPQDHFPVLIPDACQNSYADWARRFQENLLKVMDQLADALRDAVKASDAS